MDHIKQLFNGDYVVAESCIFLFNFSHTFSITIDLGTVLVIPPYFCHYQQLRFSHYCSVNQSIAVLKYIVILRIRLAITGHKLLFMVSMYFLVFCCCQHMLKCQHHGNGCFPRSSKLTTRFWGGHMSSGLSASLSLSHIKTLVLLPFTTRLNMTFFSKMSTVFCLILHTTSHGSSVHHPDNHFLFNKASEKLFKMQMQLNTPHRNRLVLSRINIFLAFWDVFNWTCLMKVNNATQSVSQSVRKALSDAVLTMLKWYLFYWNI